MSMLAGPRRKQKIINLRAKNNEWSQNSNKFGQRMLEKMGWSVGKGLGANENGIVEHVIARYKNDDKGLGFEDKNDQWTKHEDDFNALLANLSQDDSQEALVSVSSVSLETKSKKSKARVHYHKFIRGKDMSRYSEKDLANIFGKKSLKKEEIIDFSTQQESNTITTDEVFTTTEQVFTEKGSMVDYFKNKLLALKSKNKNVASTETHYNDNNEVDHGFKGFSGTSDKDSESCEEKTLLSYYVANERNVEEKETMDTCYSKSKKRKNNKEKKKNHQQEILELCENKKEDNSPHTYESEELMNNDYRFKGFSSISDKDLESCEENKLRTLSSYYVANQQNKEETEIVDTCNIKTKKRKKDKKEKKKNHEQKILEMCEKNVLSDTCHSDDLMINELLPNEGKKSKKVKCAQENKTIALEQIYLKKAKKNKMSLPVEYSSLDVTETPKKKRKSKKLND